MPTFVLINSERELNILLNNGGMYHFEKSYRLSSRNIVADKISIFIIYFVFNEFDIMLCSLIH